MRYRSTRYALNLLIYCAVIVSAYGEPFVQHADLVNAGKILFLGDSITYDGRYVAAVETWLQTQPGVRARKVINVGLPSETVSGLTEEGHAGGAFPRPVLRERLDRVLAHTKPDLVFACYGMNCGIYQPLDEKRFAAYRDGISALRDAVTKAGARIVFITPAIFDNTRATSGYEGYDEVLTRYSDWLVSQRENGWTVIDLHAAMKQEVAKRRASQPDFTFSPDGVHPDDAGHWFMAQRIIDYFGKTDVAGAVTPDDMPGVAPGTFAIVRQRMGLLRDGMLTATGHQHPQIPPGLPMNEVEQKVEELNRALDALYSKR